MGRGGRQEPPEAAAISAHTPPEKGEDAPRRGPRSHSAEPRPPLTGQAAPPSRAAAAPAAPPHPPARERGSSSEGNHSSCGARGPGGNGATFTPRSFLQCPGRCQVPRVNNEEIDRNQTRLKSLEASFDQYRHIWVQYFIHVLLAIFQLCLINTLQVCKFGRNNFLPSLSLVTGQLRLAGTTEDHLVQTLLKQGHLEPIAQDSVGLYISPRMEIPKSPWATCSGV